MTNTCFSTKTGCFSISKWQRDVLDVQLVTQTQSRIWFHHLYSSGFPCKCKSPPHAFSITVNGTSFHPIIQAKNQCIIWSPSYIIFTQFLQILFVWYFFKRNFLLLRRWPFILLHFKHLSFLTRCRAKILGSLLPNILPYNPFSIKERIFKNHNSYLGTCLLKSIEYNWNKN